MTCVGRKASLRRSTVKYISFDFVCVSEVYLHFSSITPLSCTLHFEFSQTFLKSHTIVPFTCLFVVAVTQPLASSERDPDYYIVRTVPPIVGAALIVVAVVMFGLLWRYCRDYKLRMKRKGIYKCKLSQKFKNFAPLFSSPTVSGAESGSDFELK